MKIKFIGGKFCGARYSGSNLRVGKKRANKNYANVKNIGGKIKHKGAKRASKTNT